MIGFLALVPLHPWQAQVAVLLNCGRGAGTTVGAVRQHLVAGAIGQVILMLWFTCLRGRRVLVLGMRAVVMCMMRRVGGIGFMTRMSPCNSTSTGDVREQQRCGRERAYAPSESSHV